MKINFYDLLVSSFAARPSPPAEHATRLALQRLGVSASSVDQFLMGQVVVNPTDRSKLASLMVTVLTEAFDTRVES